MTLQGLESAMLWWLVLLFALDGAIVAGFTALVWSKRTKE
jgi:hypothetical protein